MSNDKVRFAISIQLTDEEWALIASGDWLRSQVIDLGAKYLALRYYSKLCGREAELDRSRPME